MKRILLILITSTMLMPVLAQESKMPIDVDLRDGMILFTLPPAYHDPLYLPMAKPRYVHMIRTFIMKEYNPEKAEMLSLLENALSKKPENSIEAKISYLKSVCLYLYLSNHQTTRMPSLARELTALYAKDAAINSQVNAGLVVDYVSFSDEMQKLHQYPN